MPAQVELGDIKGPEGERVRKLYAVKEPPATARKAERKRSTRVSAKNAAAGRTARIRALRGVGRRSLRVGRTVHRAAGSPGAAIAGIVALFIGTGIVVAVVRNPKIVTTPLAFIGASVRAFTSLFGTQGSRAATPPAQNVAKAA